MLARSCFTASLPCTAIGQLQTATVVGDDEKQVAPRFRPRTDDTADRPGRRPAAEIADRFQSEADSLAATRRRSIARYVQTQHRRGDSDASTTAAQPLPRAEDDFGEDQLPSSSRPSSGSLIYRSPGVRSTCASSRNTPAELDRGRVARAPSSTSASGLPRRRDCSSSFSGFSS